MSTDPKSHGPHRPLTDALRRELHSQAELTPARLELERRRLTAAAKSSMETPSRLRPPWKPVSAFAAVAAAIVAALIVWKQPPATEPTDTTRAEVTPTKLAGLWILSESAPESWNRPMHTPAHQGGKIVWSNNTAVWTGPDTTLAVADAGASVKLDRGRLVTSVTPVAPGKRFRIDTPLGTVTVRGTVFSITGSSEKIAVRLYEGAVQFSGKDGKTELSPGEELTILPGKSPRIRAIDEVGILADLLISEKTANLDGPEFPLPAARVEMSLEEVVADAPEALEKPVRRKPRPVAVTPAEGSDTDPKETDEGLFLDPEIAAIETEYRDENIEESPISKIEALIRERRYKECIRAADEAATKKPNGRDAERLQYLAGYCRTRSGDLKAGREAFEKYLIQFPEGRYWKRVTNILGE